MPKDSLSMNEALKEFPQVSSFLLECLEIIFPDKLPANRISSEDLAYLQGQQKVIQFLRSKHEEQLVKLGKDYIA